MKRQRLTRSWILRQRSSLRLLHRRMWRTWLLIWQLLFEECDGGSERRCASYWWRVCLLWFGLDGCAELKLCLTWDCEVHCEDGMRFVWSKLWNAFTVMLIVQINTCVCVYMCVCCSILVVLIYRKMMKMMNVWTIILHFKTARASLYTHIIQA